LKRETDIGAQETSPELMARLAEIGAEALSETLGILIIEGATTIRQSCYFAPS